MTLANVFVGVPTLGGHIGAAPVSALLSALSPSHVVRISVQGLSLLARNFNTLFIDAWIKGADYFILLHSDIGISAPPGSPYTWLEALIHELNACGGACLSVCSPIKNYVGHTSTALQLEKGNSFKLRRVTIKELAKLPADFISRDHLCDLFGANKETAGAMLVNTGVLAMNLKQYGWAQERWPGFEIRDKIVWSRDGIPKAYTLPEDWQMSKWLFEKGWPYYCTRAFPLMHFGEQAFTNYGNWGVEFDTEGPTWISISEYEASWSQQDRGILSRRAITNVPQPA